MSLYKTYLESYMTNILQSGIDTQQSYDDSETVEQDKLLEEDENRHANESGDEDSKDEDKHEGEGINETDEIDDDLQDDGEMNVSINRNEMKNSNEYKLSKIGRQDNDLEKIICENDDDNKLERNGIKTENVCHLSKETNLESCMTNILQSGIDTQQSNDDSETVEQDKLLEEDENRHESESGDDDSKDEDNSEGEGINVTDENYDDLQDNGEMNVSINRNEIKNSNEYKLSKIGKQDDDLEKRICGNDDDNKLERNGIKTENVYHLSKETDKAKIKKSKHEEEVDKANIDQSICHEKMSEVKGSEDIASLWPYFVLVFIAYLFC